jgi:hypothetical protein
MRDRISVGWTVEPELEEERAEAAAVREPPPGSNFRLRAGCRRDRLAPAIGASVLGETFPRP